MQDLEHLEVTLGGRSGQAPQIHRGECGTRVTELLSHLTTDTSPPGTRPRDARRSSTPRAVWSLVGGSRRCPTASLAPKRLSEQTLSTPGLLHRFGPLSHGPAAGAGGRAALPLRLPRVVREPADGTGRGRPPRT